MDEFPGRHDIKVGFARRAAKVVTAVAGSATSPAAPLTNHCDFLVLIHPPGLLNRVMPNTKPTVGLLCHRAETSVGISRHASPGGISGARVVPYPGLVVGALASGFDSAGSAPFRLVADFLRVVWLLHVVGIIEVDILLTVFHLARIV